MIENLIKPSQAEYDELPRGNTYVYDFLDLMWIYGFVVYMLYSFVGMV